MSAVVSTLRKAVGGAAAPDDQIAALDRQLAELKTRLTALAQAEADAAVAGDEVQTEFRSALNLGHDTTEIEKKILTLRTDAQRRALLRVELEKILTEKAAILTAKRMAARVERLQAELDDLLDEVPRVDEKFVDTSLALGSVMEEREKLIYSVNAVSDRLRKVGVPVPARNFPLPHLDSALKAKDTRADRHVPFGQLAFRWEPVEIPVISHDHRVPAIELDRELAVSE